MASGRIQTTSSLRRHNRDVWSIRHRRSKFFSFFSRKFWIYAFDWIFFSRAGLLKIFSQRKRRQKKKNSPLNYSFVDLIKKVLTFRFRTRLPPPQLFTFRREGSAFLHLFFVSSLLSTSLFFAAEKKKRIERLNQCLPLSVLRPLH